MIYKNVTPSKQPLAPLAELVAAEPPGSEKTQGVAERSGNDPGSGAARDMQNDDNE
jgi:hypothetical protein